jgi:2-keto-3-deoxy-L-rhamnonate aldolase RhmA
MLHGILGARAAAETGYDWIFLDLEHGSADFRTLCETMLAALAVGLAPVVRVPNHDPALAARVLTNGALGVIFPHVDTPQQAAACAAASRFAPEGHRGVPAFFPQLGLVKRPLADVTGRMNRLTDVIVMIESAQAVANAPAIAAVPGVDALFVGASDLTVEMGKPGEYRDPAVRAALARVARACAASGKQAGIGGIADAALLADLAAEGYGFMLAGNDLDIFLPAARARAEALRPQTP